MISDNKNKSYQYKSHELRMSEFRKELREQGYKDQEINESIQRTQTFDRKELFKSFLKIINKKPVAEFIFCKAPIFQHIFSEHF